MTSAETRVSIPGSTLAPWPGTQEIGPVADDAMLDVSLWLRPRAHGELDRRRALELAVTPPARRSYETRAALEATSAADPAGLEAVRAFLAEHRIEAGETRWRALRARGSAAALSRAFGTKIVRRQENGLELRQHAGALSVPARLEGVVRGVFGLDTWPRRHGLREAPAPAAASPAPAPASPASAAAGPAAAGAHGLSAGTAAATPVPSLGAAELAAAYEFPEGDGRGQSIAILNYGAAFVRADFEQSLRSQGIAPPELAFEPADQIRSDGPPTAAQELAIDTQVNAMLAAGAKLILYGAAHDERGTLDALAAALFDERHRPAIVSISYGWPECCWTPGALELLDEIFVAAALLGVSVFCASGDQGSLQVNGKPQVFAPASSPFVHACGGTQIDEEGAGVERAWPKSGGGFSDRAGGGPHWQTGACEPARKRYLRDGRGVPDVAALAFTPGYSLIVQGHKTRGGGTSAATPLWSALTARLNERLGAPLGFFAPLLYAKATEESLFRAATGEGNGSYSAPAEWSWNPVTGLGVPRGGSLERALKNNES